MPDPIRTVGELIARLAALPPETPLLVDGYEGGFTEPALSLIEVQQLAGLPDFYGKFMYLDEAAHQLGPHGINQMTRDPAPVRVGGPVTAAVLRR